MPKEATFSVVGIQGEPAFLGGSVAPARRLRGTTRFDWDVQRTERKSKVTVWRTIERDSFGTIGYSGSIDFELSVSDPLRTLLGSILETVSIVGEPIVATMRPERGHQSGGSFKIFVGWDEGPWRMFEGCTITRLRIQARPKSMVQVSADFIAAKMTLYSSDPSWTIEDVEFFPLSSSDVDVSIGGTPHPGLTEFGIEIVNPKALGRRGRNGIATTAAPIDRVRVEGDLAEFYLDGGEDLSAIAEAMDERELVLAITTPGHEATRYLQVNLPAIMFYDAGPTAGGGGDAILRLGYRAVLESAVDLLDEARVTLALPQETTADNYKVANDSLFIRNVDTGLWREIILVGTGDLDGFSWNAEEDAVGFNYQYAGSSLYIRNFDASVWREIVFTGAGSDMGLSWNAEGSEAGTNYSLAANNLLIRNTTTDELWVLVLSGSGPSEGFTWYQL